MNRRYLIGVLLATGLTMGLVGNACSEDAAAKNSDDDSLVPRTVHHEGHVYHCIKYTTVDRGGLWCERIG